MKDHREGSKIHVLGIESSCDDTGVAIVDQSGNILSNVCSSQQNHHLRNGGIIPMVAKEYHVDNIDRVARQAFLESGLSSFGKSIDAIAVCTKPGLEHSLQVGLNYARTLAKKYSKPVVPIHHMRAHALMPLLQNRSIRFPFMVLLLSGGHCLLSIVERHNKFHLLGGSRDDAPGDILDKFARRLRLKNLGPPFDTLSGGASVELLASQSGSDPFSYFNDRRSVPMLTADGCEFSFSGYRAGIEKIASRFDPMWMSGQICDIKQELPHVCASLQRVMLIQIVKKLQRALGFYKMHWRHKNPQAFASHPGDSELGFDIMRPPPPGEDTTEDAIDVVVSGGVAANKFLLDGIGTLCSQVVNPPSRVFAPSKELCSDNGLMIAWNGLLRYRDFLYFRSVPANKPEDEEDSIICDSERLDLLRVQPRSSLGSDLSSEVNRANFKLTRLEHPLFKIRMVDDSKPDENELEEESGGGGGCCGGEGESKDG